MSKLIVGKLLYTTNSFFIKKFHIVTSISIQEIIGTNPKPEQTDLLVCVVCIIVYTSNICRCERAVTAQIREFIKITQAIEQSLITTTRETSNGTMVLVIDSTIVLLDKRHQIIYQVFAKNIAAKSGLWSTICSWSCEQLCWISIG